MTFPAVTSRPSRLSGRPNLIGRVMHDTSKLLRYFSAIIVVVSSVGLASVASAQTAVGEYGDAIHVVQPKPVLQKGRFSLTPRVGMTVNDAVHRNFKFGATANYHFTERLYAGALLQWYNFGDLIGGETQASRSVNAETGARVDAPYLNWAAGAEIGFVPLYGKFSLLNRGVIFYDVSVTAGGVFVESSSLMSAGNNAGPGGTLSISSRFFLNDWMAVNVELRDVLYLQNSALSHSVTLSGGLSLYLPMSFEYSERTLD